MKKETIIGMLPIIGILLIGAYRGSKRNKKLDEEIKRYSAALVNDAFPLARVVKDLKPEEKFVDVVLNKGE